MKRILKASILSFVFCLSALVFAQAASAHGYGHGYRHGMAVYHGHGHFYGHGRACGYGCANGNGNGYGYANYGRCFKCCSYDYDCCTGCYYKKVTFYRSCCVPCTGYTTDCCGCQKCYSYYKHYTYPIKSVKFYCPVSCNSCCNWNSCYNNCGSCCNYNNCCNSCCY